MGSTISFENVVVVVFWIQFDFTTGCVPIVREHHFNRPCPMLVESLLSCE
jgi:hypothetical protein